MSTYLITRHQGAVHWVKSQGIVVDEIIQHLELSSLKSGDVLIGTLPINLVAELGKIGVRYFHLTLNIPESLRGKELTLDEMNEVNAYLQEYRAEKVEA